VAAQNPQMQPLQSLPAYPKIEMKKIGIQSKIFRKNT
jgi:hypothetical protein